MQKIRFLMAGAIAISMLVASPALARRTTSTPTGVCLVTPNPVSNDVAGQYTVAGGGLKYGQTVDIYVVSPTGQTTIYMRSADVYGNVSAVGWAPFLYEDGQWTVNIYQAGDRRMTVLASCTFVVS